jgi:hypothetical protein
MAAMTSLHRTATHEAGHAVAAHLLRLPVRHVLVSDGRGEVAYYPVPVGPANIARRAVVSLAGPASELERYGDGHAAGDLTRIRGQLEPARPGLARQRSWTGTAAARRPCASGRRSTRSPQPAAARAPHRLRRRRHRRPRGRGFNSWRERELL